MPKSRTAKKIAALSSFLFKVLVACGLMLWGAFNIGTNVMEFRAGSDPNASWGIAAVMILITSIAPFVVGLWMLIRVTKAKPEGAQRPVDGPEKLV